MSKNPLPTKGGSYVRETDGKLTAPSKPKSKPNPKPASKPSSKET